MNARVAMFNIKPGKREEAINLFKEVVVPGANKQKGFKGGLLLTDPDRGKGISIGLWETEADMTATEKSGFYQQWVAKFSDVFENAPFRRSVHLSYTAMSPLFPGPWHIYRSLYHHCLRLTPEQTFATVVIGGTQPP